MSWLDPPEYDEGPRCPNCKDGYGDYLTGNSMVSVYGCEDCLHRWLEPVDQAYEYDEPDIEPGFFSAPPTCPHGQSWGECDACDRASDHAYDAAREARYFR